MYPNLARNPVVLATTFGVYFALGQLGLALGRLAGAETAVWPPSGFALAATLVLGRPIWPAILAGAFALSLSTTGYIAASVTVAIGHALAAVIGAELVDRMARGVAVFKSATTIFRFAAIAALVIAPIGASFGAVAVTFVGAAPWTDLAPVAMRLWLANLTGILVVAPFVTLWATTPFERARWIELLEMGVLLLFLVAVGLVVFGGRFPSDVQNYPLDFLCVPVLLWAAFRFGRRHTATALMVLAGIAVWGTLRGFGPFARDSEDEALVLLQAYTSVMAITGLVLAAVVAEHRAAEAQLLELATTDPLTGLVNYRRLLEVLRTEIARSGRTKRPFAILFLDMNGLKKINDKHGHLVGSRALCRIADALRRSCRVIDTPARFGGDEFAVVLPETGDEGGWSVLGRVSQQLAADSDKLLVTVSAGIAVYPRDGDSPTLLLRAADKALYEAKTQAKTRRSTPPPGDELKTGTLF